MVKRSKSVWLVRRRKRRRRRRSRRRRRTRTSRPAGMTLDSGGDLLLAYSDERLCRPSDNCSLRGAERSINQRELRNWTRSTCTPDSPPAPPHQPGGSPPPGGGASAGQERRRSAVTVEAPRSGLPIRRDVGAVGGGGRRRSGGSGGASIRCLPTEPLPGKVHLVVTFCNKQGKKITLKKGASGPAWEGNGVGIKMRD